MSNLLQTADGRGILIMAQRWALLQKAAKFFERRLNIDFWQWKQGGEFDLKTFLGELNQAHDQELLDIYQLLGAVGGLDMSLSDMTIHVDPLYGDDVEGSGAADRPYASLWFLPWLPHRINHLYRILLYGDLDTQSVLSITAEIGAGGCLSFIGVGAEDVVFPALNGNVVAATNCQSVWWELTGSVAPTTDLCRTFLQLTGGAESGKAVPVCRVNAGTSRIWVRRYPITGVVAGAGTTYRFVKPAHRLTVRGLEVNATGSRRMTSSALSDGARVNFINLTIVLDGQGLAGVQLACLSGLPIGMWFCELETPASPVTNFPIRIEGDLNSVNPFDSGIVAVSGISITNALQLGVLAKSAGVHIVPALPSLEYDNSSGVNSESVLLLSGAGRQQVTSLDCLGYCLVDRAVGQISYSSIGFIFVTQSTYGLYYVALDPQDITIHCAAQIANSTAFLYRLLFGYCQNALEAYLSAVEFGPGGGAGTITNITGYSLKAANQAHIFLYNTWTGTAGTLGAILFADPNPDQVVALPVANTPRTDNLNNWVTLGA